jgi:prolyl-tRNA synthetase
LGQNFSKACGIKFEGRKGTQENAWTTSWGTSTRMVGTLVMAHSDDDGLILPPRIAPTHVMIIPVIPKDDVRDQILTACENFAKRLNEKIFFGRNIEVEIDKRDANGGVKNWEWIKKGVPIRIEIGPRDLEKNQVAIARRDREHRKKDFVNIDQAIEQIPEMLSDIQNKLLEKASAYSAAHTVKINTMEEFKKFFTAKNESKPEIHGGFALCHWAGSRDDEAKIKQDFKVTIRCIPNASVYKEEGKCILTGKPSQQRVVFAKSY